MSVRFFLIFVTCIAVAILYSGTPNETILSRSGRELDLSIVGHGYFVVREFDTENVGYTRSGRMSVNSCGQLAIKSDSKDWILEPPIQLPNDWERVAIHQDGCVECLISGTWNAQGQMRLARFTAAPAFSDSLNVSRPNDASGPPSIANPLDVQSTIQQGWIESRRSTWLIVMRNLLIALLASILLNSIVVRGRINAPNKTEPNDATERRSRAF